MLEQLFHILETAAQSEQAALLIALASAAAIGWGWWRSESAHNDRYKSLVSALRESEEDVSTLSREALSALQDVAAALAGMERTLDGVEMLIHTVLKKRLNGVSDGNEK